MSVLFVSLFDKNYLVKGVSMIDSLLDYSDDHGILILSLDEHTFITLNSYFRGNSRISIKKMDFIDRQVLTQISKDRTYREYCWALSSILSFTALSYQELDVIYLDADLYFFNSVEKIVNKCSDYNAAITPHRFTETYKHLEINGKFNVQWVYFKNNNYGRRIALDWMNDCIVSTKYDIAAGIVGDQKYLDLWPSRYENILEISDIGVGLAPWNQEGAIITNLDNSLHVGFEEKLVFYHFHSLNIYFKRFILPVSSNYHLSRDVFDQIYVKYASKISDINFELGTKNRLTLSKGVLSCFLNFLQVSLVLFTQTSIWRKIKKFN
jgi:hypothetical protein